MMRENQAVTKKVQAMKVPTQVEMECLDDLIKNANRVYDQSETRVKRDLRCRDSFLPILPFFLSYYCIFLKPCLGYNYMTTVMTCICRDYRKNDNSAVCEATQQQEILSNATFPTYYLP